jgi:cytochrome c oxidase subunit 4
MANSPKTAGHGAETGHDTEHFMIPFATYIKVFSALIILTIITVTASRFDFGAWNAVVAFLIATVKATLVLGFFMHLKYDNMMNRVIIGSGVFFLIVLYFFIEIDEITRIIQHSTL